MSRAARSYEQERPGLGERFLAELGESLDQIAVLPTRFRLVGHDVRRCALRRFPYAIYFSTEETKETEETEEPGVVVIAVLHRRRNPDVWQSRL